MSFDSVRG